MAVSCDEFDLFLFLIVFAKVLDRYRALLFGLVSL